LDDLATSQPTITPRHLVESICIGEGLSIPGEEAETIADGLDEYGRLGNSGKIDITCEIFN
jgi:hypothetical protein